MITVAPLQEAVDRMSQKTPVARALSSDEWSQVPQDLRDRAFFTANFAKADVLQLMHEKLSTALQLGKEQVANGERFVSRSSFIGDMKQALRDSGYVPEPGKEGSLQDHSSRGRLGLIYDINTQMAQEFGRWKVGQSSAILNAFPAQQLIREQARKVPRKWPARWASHGGREFGGRMIARKDDPIWRAISAFGNPYPPFDYNSGMGIRDVGRRDAEALGVIKPGEKLAPEKKGFNDNLSVSTSSLSPEVLDRVKAQFGDQVVIQDGRASWHANLIKDFVAKAFSEPSFKGKISLGVATARTVEAAKDYADLEGYELLLTADETRHSIKKHGVGNERQPDQQGLTPNDFVGIADLWRSPDEVGRGNQKKVPNSLIFKKEIDGVLTMVTWSMSKKNKTILLHTLWKKIEGGAS